MQFIFPQFIEREAKLVGPLTFKQLIILGITAVICFYFYFTASFFTFLLSVFSIGAIGFALAFLKIRGLPLPTILGNLLKFTLSPKVFIWKRGDQIIFKKIEMKEERPLKITKDSQLKKVKLKVETEK